MTTHEKFAVLLGSWSIFCIALPWVGRRLRIYDELLVERLRRKRL